MNLMNALTESVETYNALMGTSYVVPSGPVPALSDDVDGDAETFYARKGYAHHVEYCPF